MKTRVSLKYFVSYCRLRSKSSTVLFNRVFNSLFAIVVKAKDGDLKTIIS